MTTYSDYLNRMAYQYLDTADWADGPELEDETVDPNAVIGWSNDAIDKARKDCATFLTGLHPSGHPELSLYDYMVEHGISPEQAGHDLWLTRNRHGAGFWDRGLGEVGDRLTAEAHDMGQSWVYVTDDGWQELS